jgi:hypothetical protein
MSEKRGRGRGVRGVRGGGEKLENPDFGKNSQWSVSAR